MDRRALAPELIARFEEAVLELQVPFPPDKAFSR
jgi:hypothetical protein